MQQIIHTNNAVLAALLQMCGEQCVRVSNQYDADQLAKSKRKARELHKAGIAGQVDYFFEVTDRAYRIMKAFDKQKIKLAAGEQCHIESVEDDVARVVATYADTLKRMGSWWQELPSLVKKATSRDSFTVVSMNASKETLEHLAA